MEKEQRRLTQDDVLDLIGKDGKSFPLEPLFSQVIITLNSDENDEYGLGEKVLSEIQFVVAAGETAKVQAGQKVIINLEKMMVRKPSNNQDAYEQSMEIKVDPLVVDEQVFGLIEDRFIKCKDNR